MLDSDDPATRLLAINALERITGDRLGFDYAAPEAQRQAAISRWVEKVGQGLSVGMPATLVGSRQGTQRDE
jgi:hypothetical protein